jgi:hypothetical protein
MNVDSLVTASDRLIGQENSYITLKEIFDPGLILRAECFSLSDGSYFVDLVFHLNRRYRRRLALSDRTIRHNHDLQTRVFKRPTGVFSALSEIGVKEIRFYVGEGIEERIKEIRGDEQ